MRSLPLPNPDFCDTMLYAGTNTFCSHSILFSPSMISWVRLVDSSWVRLIYWWYLSMSSRRSNLRVAVGFETAEESNAYFFG